MMVFVFLFLYAASAAYSAAETALTASDEGRLAEMANNKIRGAAAALRRKEKAAAQEARDGILCGNNIVNNTLAGVTAVLFQEAFGEGGALVGTLVVTVALLLFGEILPKGFAAAFPETAACRLVPLVDATCRVLFPVVRVLGWIQRQVIPGVVDRVSARQAAFVIDKAAETGGLPEEAAATAKAVLRLPKSRVRDIFVHRKKVVAVDETASRRAVAEIFRKSGKSSVVVVSDSDIDHVVGVLDEDAFDHAAARWRDAVRPPLIVPATMALSRLFQMFLEQGDSVAVVVDEFGGTDGIVSLDDVLSVIRADAAEGE